MTSNHVRSSGANYKELEDIHKEEMNYYYDDEYEEEEEEYEEEININKLEKGLEELENHEEEISCAEDVFQKLKFYSDFHGLNFFTLPEHVCVSNLMILE